MMVFHIRPEVLEHLREEYPAGCEVELIEMCDPYRGRYPCSLEQRIHAGRHSRIRQDSTNRQKTGGLKICLRTRSPKRARLF